MCRRSRRCCKDGRLGRAKGSTELLESKEYAGKRRQQKKRDHQQDHEIDIDEQNNAAVVEIPPLLQAPGGIPGGGADSEQGNHQPQADMDLGEAGNAETDPEGTESQDRAARQGLASQLQDGKTERHRPLL